MLIALGNGSLASYPPGGGHWSWFLQYPLGLRALGHQVLWLELLKSSGARTRDLALIRDFFARIRAYDIEDCCAILLLDNPDIQDLERAEAFGMTRDEIARRIADADLLWSLSCAIREPLLSRFRRRMLIDTDPGHLQVSALSWDLGMNRHDAFLTVGAKIHDPDCDVAYAGRTLSASKRSLFALRAIAASQRTRVRAGGKYRRRRSGGDRPALKAGGWKIAEPHAAASTPENDRDYIRRSRAEILPQTDLSAASHRMVQRSKRMLSRKRTSGDRGRDRLQRACRAGTRARFLYRYGKRDRGRA
jgi:hypothetical protein